jgi:RIO kinase 1
MRAPPRLQPLIDAELIDEVLGQLQSGKEAEVFIVRCGDIIRCAKVYKDAKHRTFKQKTQYTEGRRTRGGRQARALESKSRFGQKERESVWQSAEVDALAVLAAAGVRVPQTFTFYEGVLLLELVVGADGSPAPRLNDVDLTPEQAKIYHLQLVREAVRMLCAGLVHGDYSEFNVLLAHDGPVIIDLPQVVQATANNAFTIFERDLRQLTAYFSRFAPDVAPNDYPKEIWRLYRSGELRPDSQLTGRVVHATGKADVREVLSEIDDARDEAMVRRGPRK